MRYFATVLLLCTACLGFAQEGYEIRVTLKPFKNQYIYLGHYYGKQLPIIDSIKLDENSQGVFRGSKKLGGGIYLVGYPDRAHNFEILVDKNQRFSIVADTAKIHSISFTGSKENVDFKAYQAYMTQNGRAMDSLYKLRSRVSPADSIAINQQLEAINARIKTYRTNLVQSDPNSLLSVLLTAMKEPEVPRNDPAAKTDSLFAYKYFKKHYWDGGNVL